VWRRNILLGSIFCVLTIGVVMAMRRDRRPDIHITTASVTKGTVKRLVLASGTLQAARTVDVSTQVSGTVQSLEADFNSVVRAGQIVARLDPAAYRAQLDEAGAKLAQAEAELSRLQVVEADMRTRLARAEALSEDALISGAELETTRVAARQAAADVKAKQADVRAAMALVNQAKVSLEHTIIRSPINGIVVGRNVEVGQTVAASVQAPLLFTIADLSRMHVLAEINEAEVGGVRPGANVTFQLESMGDQTFQGTITQVRLQPVLAQAGAPTAGTGSATSGTSGTPGSATVGGSGTTQTTGNQPAATSGTSTTGASAGRTGTTPQQSASAGSSGVSSSGRSAGSAASTSSPASPSATAAPSAGAAAGVVTYTAVIEVANPENTLNPGSTAIITLPTAQRDNVVRIPNNALTFRPSQETLARTGQADTPAEPADVSGSARGTRVVWRYENDRFLPITVQTGLSDEQWTELVSGDLHPGDLLVASAAPTKPSPPQAGARR
jgi:RND family efflux transporter MFP subunit